MVLLLMVLAAAHAAAATEPTVVLDAGAGRSVWLDATTKSATVSLVGRLHPLASAAAQRDFFTDVIIPGVDADVVDIGLPAFAIAANLLQYAVPTA